MNKMLGLAVIIVLFHSPSSISLDQTCSTNCQDYCRVNFPGGSFVDIGCVPRCEIGRIADCNRIPLPPAERPPDPRALCGEPMRQAMLGVAAACSNWSGRLEDQNILLNAKNALVSRGFLAESDFSGIEMRWCPSFNGEGIAPDAGRVYLHTSLKQVHPISLTATVAHELYHIQQYRRLGGDEFRCQYLAQMTACACQDHRHPLERDAYAFGDRVIKVLEAEGYGAASTGAPIPAGSSLPPGTMGPGDFMPPKPTSPFPRGNNWDDFISDANSCETPRGTCSLPRPTPIGARCACLGSIGTATLKKR